MSQNQNGISSRFSSRNSSQTFSFESPPRKEDPLLGTSVSVEKATKVIAELGLLSLQLGDYMVIVRPDFDLELGGEPYVALMLLFNPRNGTFITREETNSI